MIYEYEFKIKLNLQLFADGQGGEKTEKPTPKKRREAREEGQVAKSQEVSAALLFIAMFFMLQSSGGYMLNKMNEVFRTVYNNIGNVDNLNNNTYIMKALGMLFGNILIIILPILATSLIISIVGNIIQTGWFPTLKPLKPKFSKLNPIEGFKKTFSKKMLTEFFKIIMKISILATIIYVLLKSEQTKIYKFINMTPIDIAEEVGRTVTGLGMKTGMFFIAVAAIDYFFQRREHEENLKMTKYEVKQEYKQTEGNPEIKGKIRQKMREASMRRMMQDIPKADVVITNPTHFAVAVKYDHSASLAPIVVGKGADYMAKRIKDIARENDIEIIENKPLARGLYASCEIGDDIPPDMYEAVAEVLAFVYKLKN
ncbi:MAG: flagellar biosynthesis protein FlhB [Clostridia bacterium]|jgi:flagellar biosynthetic protein FlhB|nr:flagellar biosynthesis protein FlhB [Clostridia bacterium]